MRWDSILDIYITDICNLNCEYCFFPLKKKEKVLNYEEFISKVDLNRYSVIRFLGWEPLLRMNYIKKIINFVKSRNDDINFVIVTNWLLLNKDILDFCNLNKVSIAVSLHKKGLNRLLKKKYLDLLLKYKNIIGFVLLYDYENISFTTQLFFVLVKLWFNTFSIAPLNSAYWDDNRLMLLENELNKIVKYIITWNWMWAFNLELKYVEKC